MCTELAIKYQNGKMRLKFIKVRIGCVHLLSRSIVIHAFSFLSAFVLFVPVVVAGEEKKVATIAVFVVAFCIYRLLLPHTGHAITFANHAMSQ